MLYDVKIIRKLFIPLFKKLNPGTIAIKHHYTGSKFFLDAFMHKGYWFHGKKREKRTMELFPKFIGQGEIVIEAGGHIGYISHYFSNLVGDKGKVYVFEPGENNIPYMEKNIRLLSNVTLIKKAVSDKNGIAKFFLENLTGQNNSLFREYEPRESTEQFSFTVSKKEIIEVETITLDSFCEKASLTPNFIKLDIEGAELLAIRGAVNLIQKHRPGIMIEITQNWEAILTIIENEDYICFRDNLIVINKNTSGFGNVFCLHKVKHTELINSLDLKHQ